MSEHGRSVAEHVVAALLALFFVLVVVLLFNAETIIHAEYFESDPLRQTLYYVMMAATPVVGVLALWVPFSIMAGWNLHDDVWQKRWKRTAAVTTLLVAGVAALGFAAVIFRFSYVVGFFVVAGAVIGVGALFLATAIVFPFADRLRAKVIATERDSAAI